MTTLSQDIAAVAVAITQLAKETGLSGKDLTQAMAIAATSHGIGLVLDFNYSSESMARHVMGHYKNEFCAEVDASTDKLLSLGILKEDNNG